MLATTTLRATNAYVHLIVHRSYSPDDVVIREVTPEADDLPDALKEAEIEVAWQEVLKRNPKAFPGPTVILRGPVTKEGGKLHLDVMPCDYKRSMVLGWLGVAMVPVTSDGYAALQAPVDSIAATIGGGIRTPGCTPPHADFFNHVIKEMEEEFGVTVDRIKVMFFEREKYGQVTPLALHLVAKERFGDYGVTIT